MPPLLPHLALAAAALLLPASALQEPNTQAPAASASPRLTLNHTVVFLDPAHGGDDSGAHLRDGILEKDVTLALANRLRFQLSSLGLTVLDTRESDPATPPANGSASPTAPAVPSPVVPSPDQRAGLANHVHPFACIILHATESGAGIHLITSAVSDTDSTSLLPPGLLSWSSAQAGFLPQSHRLAAELATSLSRSGLPVHAGRASIRPLDNLTCPAVLIELAPLNPSTSAADPAYQARVAQAVATALLFWRGHAEPDLPAAVPAGADPQP